MALQLRDSINIPQSVRQLRSCTTDLRNIVLGSAGIDVASYRDRYLSIVEPQLRSIFVDPTILNYLYSERYWMIRAVGEPQVRGKRRSTIAADRSAGRTACDCTTEVAHG